MPKIVVMGDCMLDVNVLVRVSRMSSEVEHAPVLKKRSVTYRPGGAANVAANVKSLGGDPVLHGVWCASANGRRLEEALRKEGIDHQRAVSVSWSTVTKERVFTLDGGLYRVDDHDRCDTPEGYWRSYSVEDLIPPGSVCVLADYAKGYFNNETVDTVMGMIRSSGPTALLVDPGKSGDCGRFGASFTTFKVNVAQCLRMCERWRRSGVLVQHPLAAPDDYDPRVIMSTDEMADVMVKMRQNLEVTGTPFRHLVVTFGASGAGLATVGVEEPYVCRGSHSPAVDVCGAGDTLLAALAVEIDAWQDYRHAAMLTHLRFAEKAARTAVGHRGTTAVTRPMMSECGNA